MRRRRQFLLLIGDDPRNIATSSRKRFNHPAARMCAAQMHHRSDGGFRNLQTRGLIHAVHGGEDNMRAILLHGVTRHRDNLHQRRDEVGQWRAKSRIQMRRKPFRLHLGAGENDCWMHFAPAFELFCARASVTCLAANDNRPAYDKASHDPRHRKQL